MVCEAFGGGVFAYVTQLCNDMCNNFEVYLAYSIRPQTPRDYKDRLDKRIHLIEVKNFGHINNIFKDFACIRELKKIQKDIKPDIIHLHSSIAGGIGRLAFTPKDCVILYTPHGYAHILLGNGKKSQFYGKIEKWLGKKNCITLTCCKSEDEVAQTLTKKTYYIETGINIAKLTNDLNNVKENRQHEKFTVFTLGRACEQKQPVLFNKIAELVPEADFLWVGGGELENQLTAKNITVTGWLDRNRALSIAKTADVFILCSLGEAIAMSLIENMFLKKLCLVSNVMGNKSVINNGINGYICQTPEDYAFRIKQAMADYPNSLVENAFQDVKDIYNTETMKKKFINYYNSL